MKKTIYFLAVAAMTLAVSCAKDNLEPGGGKETPERTARIEVSSDNGLFVPAEDGLSASLNFKTRGGEVVVAVSTNLDEWNYSLSDDSWLSVSADKHYLTLTAPLNESDKSRTTELTVTASDADDVVSSYVINVSQNWAGQPEITPSTNAVRFPAFGELASEVKIETNQEDLKFRCTSQWLLVEKVEGGLKLSVNPNTTTSERTVDLTLTAGEGKDAATDVIRVSQDGKAWLELSTYVAHCDGKGGESEITLESNPELDVALTPAEGEDWYSVTNTDGKVTVNITPAPDNKQRKGEISVLVGEKENTATGKIKVIQIGEDTEELIFEIQTNKDGVTYYNAGVYTTRANTNVNITVDWGDGSAPETFDSTKQPAHKYAKAGKYIIMTKGTAPAYNLTDTGYYSIETQVGTVNLLNVVSWGKLGAETAANMCKTCPLLESIPGDVCGSFSDVTSFENAFSSCYKLREIPDDIFKYASKATNFAYAFAYTETVKSIPEQLFANCPDVTKMDYVFRGLGVGDYINGGKSPETGTPVAIPEKLFAYCPKVKSFAQTFRGMNLASVPENLFAGNTLATNFDGLFMEVVADNIPSGIFTPCTAADHFNQLFHSSHIKHIPAGLFKFLAGQKKSKYVNQIFQNAVIEEFPDGFFEGLDGSSYISELFSGATFNAPLKAGMFKGLANATSMQKIFFNSNITEVPSGLLEGVAEATAANKTLVLTGLFQSCDSLTTIPADLFEPVAGKVNNLSNCFQGCAALKAVPEGLGNSCAKVANLNNMFYGCSSLASLPKSMFTGSASTVSSCNSMFENCTGLKEVPDGLFSFITRNVTFNNAFKGCTSLVKAGANVFPAKATMMNFLFMGCTSLSDISGDAFANCANVTSINSIFSGCTSLKTVPAALFSKMVKVTAFDSIFMDCSSLEAIPEGLFAANVNAKKFPKVFNNCSALKSVPAGLFAKNKNVTDFNNLFNGCTALAEIPAGLFDACTLATEFKSVFANCKSLKAIPSGLFAKNTKAYSFADSFVNCAGITEIPAGLFDSVPPASTVVTFNECFAGCTSLKSIPAGLFDAAKKAKDFGYAFANCAALTGESPYTDFSGTKVHLYQRKTYDTSIFNNRISGTSCFYGCTGLSDYDSIPNDWK